MKTLLKVTTLFLMLAILSIGAQGWGQDQDKEINPEEVTEAFLKEAVLAKMAELESLNMMSALASLEEEKLYVKADTSGTETFQAGEEKNVPHHIYWDEGAVPAGGYFAQGYVRIDYNPAVVEVDSVTQGLFNSWVRFQGPNYVIIENWYFFWGVPPINDPEVTAFTINFKGKTAGTTNLTYSITDSGGSYRGWFWAGSVHQMKQVPAQIEYGAPTPQLPNAPSDLVATPVSSEQNNLTWTDNSDNEEGFVIESKTNCDDDFIQVATVDADTTSYHHIDLRYATNYYYRVKAYNEAGDSSYTDYAAAITFAPPVSAPDEINQVIDQYYQDGLINKQGVYKSLSAKLNAIQNSLDAHNYKSALGQMNAFLNELEAQTDKSIEPHAAQDILIQIEHLKENMSFRDSLPITLKLNLLNETPCDNKANIHLPSGEEVHTVLAGNWSIQISPTADPNMASIVIVDSEYVGTPLVVDGENSGTLYFYNNTGQPSIGTLDLTTGKTDLIENVLVKSPVADLLGVSPVALQVFETGTFWPMSLIGYKLNLNCKVNISPHVPILAGGKIDLNCPSDDATAFDNMACPVESNSPNLGTEIDADGDGKLDKGFQLQEIKTDEQGNRLELWSTPETFRWRYVPIEGDPVWIGACLKDDGVNFWEFGGPDEDNDRQTDEFTGTTWYNIDDYDYYTEDGGPTTRYDFDPVTGNITVTKYRTLEDARLKRNPIGPPVTKPAPKDYDDFDEFEDSKSIESFEPSDVPVSSVAYPYLTLVLESSDSVKWEYKLDVKLAPKIFKPGDTLKISGTGIVAASVEKNVSEDKFGAWRVKEITENVVIFEATKEVAIWESLDGFCITAPNAIEGMVRWSTPYYGDITAGPVGVRY